MSLGNDDQGEEDIDANVVQLQKHWDSNGNLVEEPLALSLPADSWRDAQMLDWVLSIKAPHSDFHDKSSLDALFNECMLESFDRKVETKGLGPIDYALLASPDN